MSEFSGSPLTITKYIHLAHSEAQLDVCIATNLKFPALVSKQHTSYSSEIRTFSAKAEHLGEKTFSS